MKIINLFIFVLVSTLVVAEELPPKVITQQYENWTYQCIESTDIKNCEVSQSVRIQNSNINFSIVYSKFTNSKNQLQKIITIISPLGIDLQSNLQLKFDDNEIIELKWANCESFGCLVLLSTDTEIKYEQAQYDKVYEGLIKSQNLLMSVKGFSNEQVINIDLNLAGFSKASKQLDQENLSIN